ncbi:glycosyltransferase family 4 protein (plasmid) [Halorussus limi]|uniref:Glycosyltransferase family 4 protein n=1 Tax=Halorussus limi TaxID=2938695 RepID=A0A8U0I181_9EURY|nr:glycosyltransferase family 4 protein [Halorussus limi]UPV76666.1 glycosyltransferase family 4 protein [Halorussus limi]
MSSDIHPEVPGGLGLHVHSLSEKQAEMGHDVTVLTSDHGDRSLPRTEVRDGYALKRHREVARPVDNSIVPGVAKSLWDLADEYDVVHAHSHLFFSSNVAAAMAALTDVPLVVTNHGLFSQSANQTVQEAYLYTVGRKTFDAAERVFCYSETDRDRLQSYGVETPVSVVRNGIDCTRFRPVEASQSDEGREESERGGDGDTLLFVGRLKPGKGVRVLLRAMAELGEEFPDATLRIVGDGPLRESLEEYAAECGVADRVTFTGWLSQDRLPEEYGEATVFVLPSLNEGFPRTVLEALACETPVVTTDLPQLESVLDGVGLTVPPKSPDLLASAVGELLADDERRERMAAEGRSLVAERYSWDRTVEETTATYYDVLGVEPPRDARTLPEGSVQHR